MNQPFVFDHTMRELFEYPDPSVPFIIWTGDFRSFLDRTIAYHWHNEFEYSVLLCGELDYQIDGRHIRLCRGDAVFINANVMHMAAQVKECDNVIMFTVSFLPSLFTGGRDGTMFRKYFQPILQSSMKGFLIEHSSSEGGDIVKLLHEIYDLNVLNDDNYEMLTLSLISRLWSLTLRYMKKHSCEFISSYMKCADKKKAQEILAYIHEHYAEDLQMNDIVLHTCISRSQCFRIFQQYTNKSPIEYLTEYRLAHAVNLLTETDRSITQIATECGFSNSSYFGKIFRKKYAVTPLQFRKSVHETL